METSCQVLIRLVIRYYIGQFSFLARDACLLPVYSMQEKLRGSNFGGSDRGFSKVDITTLISKMRDQYHSLRQHYEQQLEDIEQAFEEERKEMLQKNKVGLKIVDMWVFHGKQVSVPVDVC